MVPRLNPADSSIALGSPGTTAVLTCSSKRFEGRDTAIDVTIVNTLQNSTLHQASVHSGAAVEAKEALKRTKYEADLLVQAINFTPFGVETYGAIGNGARQLLNSLGRRLAEPDGAPDLSLIMARLYFDLSMLVRRHVAGCILARQPAAFQIA